MWFWKRLWERCQAGWVVVEEMVVGKIRVLGRCGLVGITCMAFCEKSMVSGCGHEKARRGVVPGGLGRRVVVGE